MNYAPPSHFAVEETSRTHKQRQASMQRQFILVLGALLGSCLPASGQALSASLDLTTQKRFVPGPGMTLLAASSRYLPLTTVMPARSLDESPVRLPVVFAVVHYKNPSLQRLSRVRVELIQTPFIRQGRVPIAQMWSGRLRLDGFANVVSMKNVLNGPSNSSHSGTMQPRAAGVYGISLSFRLGRDASP